MGWDKNEALKEWLKKTEQPMPTEAYGFISVRISKLNNLCVEARTLQERVRELEGMLEKKCYDEVMRDPAKRDRFLKALFGENNEE